MKKYSCYARPIMISIAVLLLPVFMLAQETLTESVFDHLVAQGIKEVTITTNLAAIINDQPQAETEEEAVLSYVNADEEEVEWKLKLSVRGKFRRRICEFPPLKLDFDKSDLRDRGFASFDKYKLVTHCQENRQAAREAVLREYTAYQLYTALTPASYETHLLRVTYEDSKGEVSGFRRYAFLLESTKELSVRLNSKECEDCLGYQPAQVDLAAENLHAVFQYMIGNTDFNLPMMRNLKFFTRAGKAALPVGYDFDFSAIVAAPYAVPARELGQQSIQERIFLGFRVQDEMMEQTLAHFEDKKEELFEIIQNQRLLSSSARADMRTYLQGFYEQLTDLQQLGSIRTYSQMRQTAPQAVPPGAKPEDFGVRK